jgi:hypothetical protein
VIAEGSLIQETLERMGAALTKPGRISTVEWSGSGEQDGKVYARNQRLKLLKKCADSKLDGYGSDSDADRLPINDRSLPDRQSGSIGRPW